MKHERDNKTRPLRVVFLSITFDPEPGALRGLPLARWLRDRGGYEIKVLTAVPWYPLGRVYPGYRQKLWQWEEMDGIKILRVPIFPSHDQSALRRILTYLSFMCFASLIGVWKIGKADVVYYFDNLPTTGAVAWLISRLRGAKMVQHIADMWPDTVVECGMVRGPLRGLVERVVGGWCRFLYRRHARITVLSPGFKRMLLQRGVPEEKIDVIYNWADEGKFYPETPDPELRRELELEGRFNIIYAGNIGPLQGLETAVRAAALVRDIHQIQLVIIGTGPKETEIRRLAAELGADNVRFIGRRPVEEMNRINALADALLVHLVDIPFMYATIPSKTQVSLASARPILMGQKGDAADLVCDAGAGLVVAPEDPEAMAQAMRRLAALPLGERQAMGARGRAYYEQHLSLQVGGRIMDELFRSVA
jgi:glycosyltransferase involved in cell wall biosynthesis